MNPGASENRLRRILAIGREYLTHWAVAGTIIALTGFAPEHWVADIVSHLSIPENLRDGWLLRTFDFRLGLVAVGVAIIAWDVLRRSRPQKQGTLPDAEIKIPHLALPDKPSIAVLPFQNMSGDTEQEYFADGIADDIITDLSKISGLLVIARNSSFAYKGKSVDIRAVGRELGVRSVLEGSIRRVNNRVRITAQLINAADSAHLWAERYDRDLTDIFAVQDEVTHHIVDALKIKLTPGEAARIADIPTNSLEAHDLFLRGREILHGRKWNREIFDTAVAIFRSAIELDPNYAEAYAGLSWAYLFDFHNHLTASPDVLDVAEHFANLAMEKGPKVPFAHWIVAAVATWKRNLERTKDETEIALALNPNYALAYATRGNAELYSGNPLAAIPFFDRAIRLDPAYSQQYIHFIGSAYLVAGKYEAAAASFRERVRLAPETDLSRGLLVSALGHLGDIDETRRIWAELKQINPNYSFAKHLARLPFSNPADVARIKDGFAKTGLSD
jgi:adenylate cyclase